MTRWRRWWGRVLLRAAIIVVLLCLLVATLVWWLYIPGAREPGYHLVRSWGSTGSAAGQFKGTNGIAVHGDSIFVADSRNHRIQVFDRNGTFLRSIVTGPKALLDNARPMNINIVNGKLYVADYWNDSVRVMSLGGQRLLSVGGEAGQGPGTFRSPAGASALPNGDLLVADFYNQRVQILSPQGAFISQLGVTGRKFHLTGNGFNYPTDVAVNPRTGHFYVSDGYNDRVLEFTAQGRLLRKWGGPLAINIRGDFNGWFRTVTSLAVGPHGNVFVVDEENNRIQKFDAHGRFLTTFGKASAGPSYPYEAVAVATDGTVYTAGNDRVQVWVHDAN